MRINLAKIPRADCGLDRLQDGVFADAHLAAKHQRVIDLVLWTLYAVSAPQDDVVGVFGIGLANMVKPRAGLRCVAALNSRRTIQVEASHPSLFEPPAMRDKPISDEQGLTGRPGHLFHGPVLVKP